MADTSLAQPNPPQPVPPIDPAAEFAAGVAAYDLANFEQALTAFERSYAARPVAAVLYNIAATQRALGRQDEAAASYRRYLAEDVSMTPERRDEVEGILVELRRRVSRLILHVDPAGAEVRIDGTLSGVAPLPDAVTVDPGEHIIEVIREGHVFEPMTLTVPPGIEQTITLRARALPPPVLPRERGRGRDHDRDRGRDGGGLLASPVFWIVTSVVVIGAGTAATWYLTRPDEGPPQSLHVHGAFDALMP